MDGSPGELIKSAAGEREGGMEEWKGVKGTMEGAKERGREGQREGEGGGGRGES